MVNIKVRDKAMSEAATTEQQPLFNIEKLYVKDLSLESPNAPSIFWSVKIRRLRCN